MEFIQGSCRTYRGFEILDKERVHMIISEEFVPPMPDIDHPHLPP